MKNKCKDSSIYFDKSRLPRSFYIITCLSQILCNPLTWADLLVDYKSEVVYPL